MNNIIICYLIEGMSREVFNLGGAALASADVSIQPTSSPKIGISKTQVKQMEGEKKKGGERWRRFNCVWIESLFDFFF